MSLLPTDPGHPLTLDNKVLGCVIGIVTDNVHPEHDYRVRVRFPWLTGSDQSRWARIATLMASRAGAGAFFLPEINDEVLVVFEHGDFDYPIVVGCLWNGIDKPLYCNRDGESHTQCFHGNDQRFQSTPQPRKNDIRAIATRAKHALVFNDNPDHAAVILSSGQKHRIVLSDEGTGPMQIAIIDGKEENHILIDSKNRRITIESKTGDLLLRARNSVRIECNRHEVETESDIHLKAGGSLNAKASGNVNVQSSGGAAVESSSTLTLRGATVNIN